MVSKKKSSVSFLVIISIMSLITVLPSEVLAQNSSSTSPPAIQWQQYYGNMAEYASNLIQTSDGGYAFMDEGWSFQDTLVPATIYKVDSSGNINWTKTIDSFSGVAIKQTSDNGLEVSGYWVNGEFFTPEDSVPTLIKLDSQGNTQWVKNYSSVPNLGVAPSSVGKTKTSDGGFVYWSSGSIVKTSSDNSTQWVKSLTYEEFDNPNTTAPLGVCSVIESSNGSLAILGVGDWVIDNVRTGRIYLIETEPFLSSPAQQPTSYLLTLTLAILVIVFAIIALAVAVVFRHRKTAFMYK